MGHLLQNEGLSGVWEVLRSSPSSLEIGLWKAAQAAALEGKAVIPPFRLLRFYHFFCHWPVLQDKLERKLATEELGVGHLDNRGAKTDAPNPSLRPPS